MKKLILIAFLAIPVLISIKVLLLKSPPIWPDEVTYADIAENFLERGQLGTDVWAGIVPGIHDCLCWYPPLMTYLLAGWFKIFGFSIANQRLLSVTLGVGTTLAFYFILQTILGKKTSENSPLAAWIPIVTTLVLAFDITFFKATRLSRPEIFVLFFGSFSLLFFLKSENFLAGTFAGMALITHFLGWFFIAGILLDLLFYHRLAVFRQKRLWLICLGFLIPLIFWALTLIPHLDYLKTQLPLIWSRKTAFLEEVWFYTVFKARNWPMIILYSGYLAISLLFLGYVLIKKKGQFLLSAIILSLAWVSVVFGRMLWYVVLLVPFVYLSGGLVLYDLATLTESQKKLWVKLCTGFMMFILVLLAAISIQLEREEILLFSGDRFSYEKLTEEVLKIIPDNKPVFLSSIPDLYFGFKQSGRKNPLYEFPGVAESKEVYARYLSQASWAVFSKSYDWPIYGAFLPTYLDDNERNVYFVGEELQNQVYVIELKPKKDRINP